jgi:hypothetical protein
MLREEGITVPQLGRMAVVPVSGSKPKVIFHGAVELNAAFARLVELRSALVVRSERAASQTQET